MQFKYIATNNQGKTLGGIINAVNAEVGRAQLNNLGFSILEFKPIQEENGKISSDLQKFEFEAIDKNGKKIMGTVPAKNELLGYKRLVEEYAFTVNHLSGSKTLEQLKAEYGSQAQGMVRPQNTETIQSMVETPEFILEKNQLMQQVDMILKQIQELITKFETKISPEKRVEMEQAIDKLLRIKTSNNIEYIKHTCKELLEKIQQDFLSFKGEDGERQSVLLQSQKMMRDLEKSSPGPQEESRLKSAVHNLEEKLKKTELNFLSESLESIESHFHADPELQNLKEQKSKIRTQLWEGTLLMIKAPKETRALNWSNIKTLWTEHQAVSAKIQAFKQGKDTQKRMIHQEKKLYWLEEINAFTGWLLTFYLIFYFVGFYITQYDMPWTHFLGIPFDFQSSVLFKYLLATTFLIHSSLSLKLNFFENRRFVNMILLPLTFILILLVLFNF